MFGRLHPIRAAVLNTFTNDRPPVQIGPGTNNRCPDAQHSTRGQYHSTDSTVFQTDLCNLRLTQQKIFLPLQRLFHDLLVTPAIRLRS